MNSKTSYTLSSSFSNTTRENFIFDSNIVKRLYLAQQKLRPIIDNLLRTATVKSSDKSYYLTVGQYEDAISASQILKEVEKILSEKQNDKYKKKNYNFSDFKFEREHVKVNKLGKIYVDTSTLIQLIELHKSLGDIISSAQEICSEVTFSNDESSYTQTNCSNLSQRNDSYDGRDLPLDKTFNVTITQKDSENIKPKIKINVLNKNNYLKEQHMKDTNLERKATEEILSSHANPLQENIVVMYSEEGLDNTKKLATLPEERTSNSEANLTDDRTSSRKIKSTGSIKCDNQDAKVTDVAGARKIILNCLYDLKKVRSFLERVDVGVSASVQIQSAITENDNAEKTGQSSRTEEKKNIKRNANNQALLFDEPNDLQHLNANNQNESDEKYREQNHKSQNDFKGECSCGSTYVSETPMELLLDAGDENASKLIICIKGKTEEDGDVQIIIRQCSECKNVGGKESFEDHSDIIENHAKEQNEFPVEPAAHKAEKHISQEEKHDKEKHLDETPNINPVFEPPDDTLDEKHENMNDYTDKQLVTSSGELEHEKNKLNILFDANYPSQTVVEPSKNKPLDEHPLRLEKEDDTPENTDKSKVILPSPNEFDQEKSGINVIFDPDEPSKSIVQPPKNVTVEMKEPEKSISPEKIPLESKFSKKSSEKDDDCSRVKLYETTNLCFSTEDGQELMISLTIRPKSGGRIPKISLNDIFSDSTTDAEKTYNQTQKHIENIFASEPEIMVGLHDKQELDSFIPLSRTKVCSSLEFDVSVMETRIQNKGIKNVNQGIVVRLKEMGVNNLLRACRPVKCGRPTVLNEKLRKGLPYSASLTSLPLEETDANIIDQSLNMSFNKTKYSSGKNKNKTMTYFTQLGNMTDNIKFTKNMQISFVYANQTSLKNHCVRKKLGYYINLVHDVRNEYTEHTYEVNFFEIKKLHLQSTTNVNTTNVNKNVHVTKEDSLHSIISKRKPALKEGRSKEMSMAYKNNHVISNPSQLKNKITEGNLKLRNRDSSKEKNRFISKIPVYKNNRKKCVFSKDKLDCDSYIYAISLQSLPMDDADEKKDFEAICNNGEKVKSTFKRLEWKAHNDLQNKICSKDWNITEKIINNNSEIYASNKTSNDSLELYFNNFFRDKYFSRLALCQEQSSNRSLKPRKKKSEYHCSRSHSQTCVSDSNLDLRRLNKNLSNQRKLSEQMYISENWNFSENNFKEQQESLTSSKSAIYYFTKMFCEYWVKDKPMAEKENVKKITKVNSLTSFGNILNNEEFKKLFRNIKERILEGWYVFYLYFLFIVMYTLTNI